MLQVGVACMLTFVTMSWHLAHSSTCSGYCSLSHGSSSMRARGARKRRPDLGVHTRISISSSHHTPLPPRSTHGDMRSH